MGLVILALVVLVPINGLLLIGMIQRYKKLEEKRIQLRKSILHLNKMQSRIVQKRNIGRNSTNDWN